VGGCLLVPGLGSAADFKGTGGDAGLTAMPTLVQHHQELPIVMSL
jgi:hypothetical protein